MLQLPYMRLVATAAIRKTTLSCCTIDCKLPFILLSIGCRYNPFAFCKNLFYIYKSFIFYSKLQIMTKVTVAVVAACLAGIIYYAYKKMQGGAKIGEK